MSAGLVLEDKEMSGDLKLRISRVIKAKRERVYDAWTKPELIQQWFAPGNMTVPNVGNELRVGGVYRIEMQGSGAACEGAPGDLDTSHNAAASGTYKKIVPNELLCFTWCGDWDRSEETLVTVAFKDVEGGTEVTVTHERFATAESRDKHRHGWTSSLEKLAKFCEK